MPGPGLPYRRTGPGTPLRAGPIQWVLLVTRLGSRPDTRPMKKYVDNGRLWWLNMQYYNGNMYGCSGDSYSARTVADTSECHS